MRIISCIVIGNSFKLLYRDSSSSAWRAFIQSLMIRSCRVPTLLDNSFLNRTIALSFKRRRLVSSTYCDAAKFELVKYKQRCSFLLKHRHRSKCVFRVFSETKKGDETKSTGLREYIITQRYTVVLPSFVLMLFLVLVWLQWVTWILETSSWYS